MEVHAGQLKSRASKDTPALMPLKNSAFLALNNGGLCLCSAHCSLIFVFSPAVLVDRPVLCQAPRQQRISRLLPSPLPAVLPLSLSKKAKPNEGRNGETRCLSSTFIDVTACTCISLVCIRSRLQLGDLQSALAAMHVPESCEMRVVL